MKTNMYNNAFGCHTPNLAQALATLLQNAGITFIDYSWHNDELDRFEITLSDGRVLELWIGDPSREGSDFADSFDYRQNVVTLLDKDGDELEELLRGATFEQMIEKIKPYL